MIEDLDGGDRAPSRARALTAVSVVLVLGAVLAYGAVSSQIFRGPYATPDPSGGPARDLITKVRYTPAPFASVDPAAYFSSVGGGCVIPGAVYSTTVFVGGQQVVFERAATVNPLSWCAIYWRDLSRQPWERIAP